MISFLEESNHSILLNRKLEFFFFYIWDRAEPENDAEVISFWGKRTLFFFLLTS